MVKAIKNNLNGTTIEAIENDYWGDAPADATWLIRRCYELRKKQIKELDTEDMRLLIRQDIALPILIPLAIQILRKDVLAEGEMYPGDLLQAVLEADEKYWRRHPEAQQAVLDLYRGGEDLIRTSRQCRTLAAAFVIFSR